MGYRNSHGNCICNDEDKTGITELRAASIFSITERITLKLILNTLNWNVETALVGDQDKDQWPIHRNQDKDQCRIHLNQYKYQCWIRLDQVSISGGFIWIRTEINDGFTCIRIRSVADSPELGNKPLVADSWIHGTQTAGMYY